METRYCIEYINPQHPLHDDGSLNIIYDRVLTLEQAEHDLTLILSFGGKILDLYMGNVVDGETGEWSPKPMIIDDEDWFSTKWLNTLEVKKVQEEPVSIWHDVSEEPKPNMELICVGQYGNPLVLSSNSNSFKERCISKWAYFNDLLNLSNVQRTVKNWKEEPISEELEEASKEWLAPQLDKSYVNYGEVKMMEFSHFDGYAMLDAIEFGARWQKTKDESITEDLGEYINELSKQFPDVSFAKLSRIAVRVAKWQKEQQIMAKAIDGKLYSTLCGSEQNVVDYVGYSEYGKRLK